VLVHGIRPHYVKEAIRNVTAWLEQRGEKPLKSKFQYHSHRTTSQAELDASPLCDDEDTNYYMQQIGVLKWAVELGRIDIAAEVSILSSYMAAPREGHLSAIMHIIYSWLKSHDRSKVVLDPSYVEHIEEPQPDWFQFYADAIEMLPPDHAGDKVTRRRSRTGILIFLNPAPVVWLSKKQNSIETSSFGSFRVHSHEARSGNL
jgi:hypothetical protein